MFYETELNNNDLLDIELGKVNKDEAIRLLMGDLKHVLAESEEKEEALVQYQRAVSTIQCESDRALNALELLEAELEEKQIKEDFESELDSIREEITGIWSTAEMDYVF